MDKVLMSIEECVFWSILICVAGYYIVLFFQEWSERDKQKQRVKHPQAGGKNYTPLVSRKLMSEELDEIEQSISN